jgi:hypothetical protein
VAIWIVAIRNISCSVVCKFKIKEFIMADFGVIKFENVKVVRTHKGGFTALGAGKKADGSVYDLYVKVWSTATVEADEVVTVIGTPSARLSEYTTKLGEQKTVAELHVGDATITRAALPF